MERPVHWGDIRHYKVVRRDGTDVVILLTTSPVTGRDGCRVCRMDRVVAVFGSYNLF